MGRKKMDINKFIERANGVHDNKYDYSKVEYENNYTKICIICPIHGEFWQTPSNHLKGCGCPLCSGNKRLTTERFVTMAREIHGDKYDYSKVEYVNRRTKICIISNTDGEFWQFPMDHLYSKGHRKESLAKSTSQRSNSSDFIEKARKIHGGKYDYSNVEYINAITKVKIVCPMHGVFEQEPHNHLKGAGCPECGRKLISESKTKTLEGFISDATKVHGTKYDYSKVEYKGVYKPVCIICPKHGEFWQKPCNHINSNSGCPKCKQSKLEEYMGSLLTSNNIDFVQQMRFPWLGLKRLDFYLPKYNVAIECQGRQHFEDIDVFGGEEGFNERKRLDEKKLTECVNNGVKVFYFSDEDFNEFQGEVVWHDAEKMIKDITKIDDLPKSLLSEIK